MFKKIQGIYNFGKNVITGGGKKSKTISSVPISKNLKKFTDQKEKIIKMTDSYKAKVNDPKVKLSMNDGTSKTLSNISKIYKGEPITKKVKKVEKKANGGRIGRKIGGGSNMQNTNVKKKYKGFSKLPETVQIKINKKLAKKV